MTEKERIVIAVIGLMLSLGLLFTLLTTELDFTYLSVKKSSAQIMSQIKEKNYEQAYRNFSDKYKHNLPDFLQTQEEVTNTLGDIIEYQLNDIKSRKKTVQSAQYEVIFAGYPEEKLQLTMDFVRNQRRWELFVIQYDLYAKTGDDDFNEKILSLSTKDHNDNNIDFVDTQGILTELLDNYAKDEYIKIYELFNANLKSRGDADSFINYMRSIDSRYGKLENVNFKEYQISTDGLELKARHEGFSSKLNQMINLVMWVRDDGGMHVSGIQFTEYSW